MKLPRTLFDHPPLLTSLTDPQSPCLVLSAFPRLYTTPQNPARPSPSGTTCAPFLLPLFPLGTRIPGTPARPLLPTAHRFWAEHRRWPRSRPTLRKQGKCPRDNHPNQHLISTVHLGRWRRERVLEQCVKEGGKIPGPEEAERRVSQDDLRMGRGGWRTALGLGSKKGEGAKAPQGAPSKGTPNGCCPVQGGPLWPPSGRSAQVVPGPEASRPVRRRDDRGM